MTYLNKALLLLPLILCLVGCGKESDKAEQDLCIDLRLENEPQASWYLLTFGKEHVQEDTLHFDKGRSRWKQKFHRDTLDLFMLLDGEKHLVAPLYPDSMPLRLTLQKGVLSVEGSRWAEEITEWYRLRDSADGEVTDELLTLLQKHAEPPFATVAALDAWYHAPNRDACADELLSLLMAGLTRSPEWASALGVGHVEWYRTAERRSHFRSHLITKKGADDQTETVKLMDKKPLMVAAFVSSEQTNDPEWAFIERLDSLGYPTYYLLPMCDTIPATWKTTPKAKATPTWHYFLPDTAGVATEWAEEMKIDRLPTYLLVDSTLLIWRRWHEHEELLDFLEQYKAAKE